MNAVRSPEQRDADLETEIDRHYQIVINGKTDDIKRAAFTEMARAIRRRSQAQIMKMEFEMRLLRQKVSA